MTGSSQRLLLLGSSLALLACRPAGQEAPAQAAVSVQDAFLEFQRVWNAGDLEAVRGVLAEDVVQMSETHVHVGKAALMGSWEKLLGENTDIWSPTVVHAAESGDLGFVTARYTETATPRAGGAPRTSEGLSLAVFRKGADGQWLEVLDSWYTPPVRALTSVSGRGPLSPEAEVVKRVFEGYVAAWNAADIEAIEPVLDETMVQLDPQEARVGKAAVLAAWQQFFAENTDVWSPVVLDIQVSGDMAYLMYSGPEVVTPKAGGAVRNTIANGWEVFRRDAAGSWRVVNESFFSVE